MMNFHKILWTNGTILDVENNKEYDWLMTRNNAIFAMGNNDERPEDFDEEFDLDGKVLMSAFIDPHSHFSANVYSFIQPDLGNCTSFKEIKETIENFIKDNDVSSDQWISATGYDHNNLREKDHPRRDFLDTISKTNPIAIHHQSGHVGVFNSAALEYLNINKDTVPPTGGHIETNDDDPTGYMEENAFIDNIKKAPLPNMDDISNSILKAQARYFSNGIVMAQEGMMVKELIPLYQVMLNDLDLDLDIVYYTGVEDVDTVLEAFPNTEEWYEKNLKFGGIKLFLDGSPQAKTAWVREAYENDSNNFGQGTLSDQQLYEGLKLAYDKKVQPLAHCNGDAAIEQYINTVAKLKEDGFDIGPLRPVLIHAQLLGKDQVVKLKDLDIIASFFIAHIKHWGDVHIENLGIDRAAYISPAKSALDNDVLITLHQDSPVILPDMIETIDVAVNRKTKSGITLGESEKLTPQEAILAVTKNAAYQYQEEGFRGKLERCLHADFVILSDNPLKVDHDKIKDIEVLKTIIKTKVVWEKQ